MNETIIPDRSNKTLRDATSNFGSIVAKLTNIEIKRMLVHKEH